MTLTADELAAVEVLNEFLDSEPSDFDAYNDEDRQLERTKLVEAAFGIDFMLAQGPLSVFNNDERVVTQLWMDDPDPDIAPGQGQVGPGVVTVMVGDVATSMTWWYDAGSLRYSWPEAINKTQATW